MPTFFCSQREHPAHQLPGPEPGAHTRTCPGRAGLPPAFKCTLLHMAPLFGLCIIDFLVSLFLSRVMHHVANAARLPPPGPNVAVVENIFNNDTNDNVTHPPLRLLWFFSPPLTYDGVKLCLILRHGNHPRNPPPSCTRGSPRDTAAAARTRCERASYLRRLGRGMEPEPEPSIFFFPLNNFSTRVTFPVRAASRRSCSFPIPDTSLQ